LAGPERKRHGVIEDGQGAVRGTVEACRLEAREPHGIVASVMSIPMRLFFKGVLRKAILQDLNDIKAAVERG
jgi:hypothetical protein